jgi:hypothetical protein
MENNSNEGGFFENLLTIVGAISGAIFGYNNGEWIGLIIGAVILGAIGKWVGAVADWVVKLVVLIVILLLNRAIRIFIWDIVKAIFQ